METAGFTAGTRFENRVDIPGSELNEPVFASVMADADRSRVNV
jgi:hypothetical protein